jgi:hypothetical protein
MSATPFEPDVSVVLLRVAKRLDEAGCRHPVEAAVALTVRGRHGLDAEALADVLGLELDEVLAAERGDLLVRDWSEPLWDLVEEDTPEFAALLRSARAHPAGHGIAGAVP